MYKKKHFRPLIIKYSLLLFLPYQAGCYLQPLQENNDFSVSSFVHIFTFSVHKYEIVLHCPVLQVMI
jgi:hypothetical protein